MLPRVVNLSEKLSRFSEQWSPKIVARMNHCDFKLAKVQGDFVWHSHAETDEVFLVLSGQLRIDFRHGSVTVNRGELVVVPRGVEHKPWAEHECHLLLIETAGTINTGDAADAGRTASAGEWL